MLSPGGACFCRVYEVYTRVLCCVYVCIMCVRVCRHPIFRTPCRTAYLLLNLLLNDSLWVSLSTGVTRTAQGRKVNTRIPSLGFLFSHSSCYIILEVWYNMIAGLFFFFLPQTEARRERCITSAAEGLEEAWYFTFDSSGSQAVFRAFPCNCSCWNAASAIATETKKPFFWGAFQQSSLFYLSEVNFFHAQGFALVQ